jgi:hypothetical protein
MSLKKYETTKLFYGKYLYKLCIFNSVGYIFRGKNLSYPREILDTLQQKYENGEPLEFTSYLRTIKVSEESFLDARKLYKFISRTKNYTLRIEGSTLCVYANDREWLHSLKSTINKNNLREIWEPNPALAKHLEPNTIIVDKDNGYEYKVTLGPGLSDTFGFANWAKVNTKQVKVGPTLLENLEKNYYVSDMYFYARDEKTLHLCNLMLSNIRRIDKLVVKQSLDK